MNRITIGNLPGLSFKEFGSMYLSSFSAIWLALEPLGAFGVFPNAISSLGWLGYTLLLVASLFISVPVSQVWRKIKFRRQEFIHVYVESSIEGVTYQVKVPATLQVWDFMHLFVEHLAQGGASEKVKATRRFYSPVLNLRRNEEKKELDKNMTMKEIGVLEGDILFISGKPIEVDLSPRFCIRRHPAE